MLRITPTVRKREMHLLYSRSLCLRRKNKAVADKLAEIIMRRPRRAL
jgi:hypothetical protein